MGEGRAASDGVDGLLRRVAGAQDGVSVTDAVDLIEALHDTIATMEAAAVRAVDLVDVLRRSGRVEELEGLPLDLLVSLTHRTTGADAWMLLETSRVLGHMPATWRRFRDGQLSWSQVRGIVHRARHVDVHRREILDRRLARTIDEGTSDRLAPDQLLDAVDQAITDLTDPRTVERREQRAHDQAFVHVQGDLFGGIRFTGAYPDPIQAATFLNALDAASDSPEQNTRPDGQPTSRARQRAHGLLRLADAWLAGSNDRRPRPQVVVHVPLDQVHVNRAGIVELACPGPTPTITARTLEILAQDADMRTVIFDHRRPLGVSDVVHAAQPTTKARIAVRARDLGGRFPGERTPTGHSQIHHLRHRADGGSHDPDNLALLGTRAHLTLVHKHGWQLTLEPYTGEITADRGSRRLTSLPHATPLAPDPGPPATTDPTPDRRPDQGSVDHDPPDP